MSSARSSSRVQGLFSVTLAVAFLGCGGPAPVNPMGHGGGGGTAGSGGVGGAAPAGGHGGTTGAAGSAGTGTAGSGAGGASGTGGSGLAGTGGGTAGTGGIGGSAGAGGSSVAGTTGSGGRGGSAGAAAGTGGAAAGTGGSSAGAGGAAGSGVACGDAGQPCCTGTTGTTCSSNLQCLNGTTCSCAKALFGRYVLRTDGALLYESDPSSTMQTPVLDGNTGLPLVGVTGVQDAAYHGCAVQGTSHTAWCWRTGANGNKFGQLGNGATDALTTSFQATQVLTAANTTLTNVVAIAGGEGAEVGGGSACAVTSDGKLYCWGIVTSLVNGGTTLVSSYAVPITTDGLTPMTGVLQVTVYGVSTGSYACAIVSGAANNELWCWGDNSKGNLGLGDKTFRTYPTKVIGITNPLRVLAQDGNFGSTCVLDGQNVRCWGNNPYGETATTASNTPVLSPSVVTLTGGATLANVSDIHGGDSPQYATFCALTTAGAVLCWGFDYGASPTNLNLTSVALLGGAAGSSVRYLTNDGLLHFGTTSNHVGTTRVPNCGALH